MCWGGHRGPRAGGNESAEVTEKKNMYSLEQGILDLGGQTAGILFLINKQLHLPPL